MLKSHTLSEWFHSQEFEGSNKLSTSTRKERKVFVHLSVCMCVCLSFLFVLVWLSVIAARFWSKECWQHSIVIKSHTAKTSVYQLELKVAWVCVGPLLNDNERNGIYVCSCACATATRGSRQCHSQSEFVTGVWQAPQEDCLMCWYRQECFLKVFCREEEEEEKKQKGINC